MSTLFQRITNDPDWRKEIYNQFCLDACRMHIILNGNTNEFEMKVKCFYTWLVNLFTEPCVGLWFAYWCTQTALASIYHEKVMDLNAYSVTDTLTTLDNVSFHYHLVDNGKQWVYINFTEVEKNEHADLHVYKPFRVCYYKNDRMHNLCFYHLHVKVSTQCLGHYEVQWTRFLYDHPLTMHYHIVQEKDAWVVVLR